MPEVTPPESRFLNAEEFKKVFFENGKLKEGFTEKDTFFVIKEAFVEPLENNQRLQGCVFNKTLGEKQLYEFKSKLSDLFEAFGNNTDNWIGKVIKPILQGGKDSMFFKKFEVIHSTTEDIKG